MPRFLVTWTIDIEGQETPLDAARQAFAHMQRPGTSANCFEVIDSETGEVTTVDLEDFKCSGCGEVIGAEQRIVTEDAFYCSTYCAESDKASSDAKATLREIIQQRLERPRE